MHHRYDRTGATCSFDGELDTVSFELCEQLVTQTIGADSAYEPAASTRGYGSSRNVGRRTAAAPGDPSFGVGTWAVGLSELDDYITDQISQRGDQRR